MASTPSTRPQSFSVAQIRQLAGAFGLDPEKVAPAIAELADSTSARVQRKMLSRGGVADIVDVLLHDAAPVSEPDAMVTEGNRILDVLTGSKHISRGIAGRVARDTGIDVETAKRLLPAVASHVMSAMRAQALPQIRNVAEHLPALSGSPLPLPGEAARRPGYQPTAPADDWTSEPARAPAPSSRGSGAGSPLPLPGDNIPGIERGQRGNNPFDRLPDIIRRGGTPAPAGGGSLDNIIRSILNSVLGNSGGVIGTMVKLFLVRWATNFVRRLLGRVFMGR